MAKVVLTFLLCFIAYLAGYAQDDDAHADDTARFNPKVKYGNFKVPVYKGKVAGLNIHSSQTAYLYRTKLREGYKTHEINFAGHYVIVTWGCGSSCLWGALIDAKDGSVYDLPQYWGDGYDFKKNSRLLIVNATDSISYYFKNRPYEVPAMYIFDDSTKKFKQCKHCWSN